jgi:arylsulfatase A-like enzyme
MDRLKAVRCLTSPLTLALFASATCSASAQPQPATRPNVIVLLPDQWRAQAFGFAGDPNVQTPNLDRLARASIDCVNAVAGMPVCCPSRASLLTGERPLTNGVFLNDVPLNPQAVTLAKVLGAAGYDTGYIGKWHLNGGDRSAFIPRERRQGFDYWKALGSTHDYTHSVYYADGPEPRVWPGYDATAQTDDAVRYVRARAASDRPFFLVLAWGPPHGPYDTAPASYRARYAPEKLVLRPNVPAAMSAAARQMLAGYYAHCSALDDCVGTLWAALRETGLEQNTLLVFLSDHGDLLGSHGGQHKQQPYDESVRIPLLLHWPAGLGAEPQRRDALINSEDFMPTILGLCRVAIPATVEGRDYSAYLRDGRDPSDGAALLSCAAPFGQWSRLAGGREYRGIRTRRYTYVRDLKGPWLLFDDETDPYQQTNLAGRPECTRLQAELEATLERKLAEAHDEFLPAQAYIRRWGYTVDANGTVPYRD